MTVKQKMTQAPTKVLVDKSYLPLGVNQIHKIKALLYVGWENKKEIEDESESDSESEEMNIKVEKFLPSFGIKETIFISDDETQDESKSNIKKFVPVKQVEDIIILSDSD